MELEERTLRWIRQDLKRLPEGRLKLGSNGKSVYENVTHSLPPNSQRAVDIAQRNLLERKQAIIEGNLKGQRKLLNSYKSYRDDRVLAGMSKVYQKVLESDWERKAREVEAARERAVRKALAEGTAYHGEHLVHTNLKGEIQRSKSELVIGTIYEGLRIPYSYETIVRWPQDAPAQAWEIKRQLGINDFYMVDFACEPAGGTIYHEHLGLMDDSGYMMHWMKKQILYFWAGITPGNNLIVTADDRWGGINMRQIQTILRSYLGDLIGTAR